MVDGISLEGVVPEQHLSPPHAPRAQRMPFPAILGAGVGVSSLGSFSALFSSSLGFMQPSNAFRYNDLHILLGSALCGGQL